MNDDELQCEYGSSQPVRFVLGDPIDGTAFVHRPITPDTTTFRQRFDSIKNIIENSWVVNLRTHQQTHQPKYLHKLKRLPRKDRGRFSSPYNRCWKYRPLFDRVLLSHPCPEFLKHFLHKIPVNSSKTCTFRRFNGL